MSAANLAYVLVEWIHEFESDPVQIAAELDETGCEIRKVEVFRGGLVLGVDHARPENDPTFLSFSPWPTVEGINLDKGEVFKAKTISGAEFERIWKLAATQ